MSRIVCEYDCPHHGRFEHIEEHEPQDDRPCPECGADSPYVLSAVSVRPSYASVTTGRDSSERPPGFISTSALADGMKPSEYRERLAEQRRERIRQHVRSKLG